LGEFAGKITLCYTFFINKSKVLIDDVHRRSQEEKMTLVNILVMILVGALAGWVADYLVKAISLGMLGKIIDGILGGVQGGWLFNL
jgi:F0F1-type ATP synthase assembly protein I